MLNDFDYKIAVIGGGTGLSSILRGIRRFPIDITAIVTVADDGGSSGDLRTAYDVPPPGDVRNVMAALSDAEPLIRELFQYRFKDGSGLNGHPTGNLLLAAMTDITGNFAHAVRGLSEILNVRGKVLPISNKGLNLSAEYEDGTVIRGESVIPNPNKRIKRVFYDESGSALTEALEAVLQADLVVLAPGSLYTSIIPNLLFDEMKVAISQTSAKFLYCCNIMSQPGETTGFSVYDHVKAIEDHVGFEFINTVLVNDAVVRPEVLEKYRQEGSFIIPIDDDRLAEINTEVIRSRLLVYNDQDEVRHNSKKVASMIFSLLIDL